MAHFRNQQQTYRRLPRRVLWLLVALVVIVIAGVVVARHAYNEGLKPVNSSQKAQLFTVDRGSSVKEIAKDLEEQHLIKSAWALELYVHSKELGDKLQAGTYAFSPGQGTISIVTTLSSGNVARKLVTILPGRRIDQVRADLINDGFSPTAVDQALDPAQYGDVPVLSFKPANVTTLEGLLWPDSYEKDQSTSPSIIIRESLLAMGEHLTPDVQAVFASRGLTTYQGVILASIVLQEVNKPTDQAQAAQVFFSRLKTGMMLGSDVTARYGAIAAGHEPSLTYDSPYNTLKHMGLPPSPISTINATALDAVIHPANTEWLYFVAGDNGTTYFSSSLEEHQNLTDKYCHKLCGR